MAGNILDAGGSTPSASFAPPEDDDEILNACPSPQEPPQGAPQKSPRQTLSLKRKGIGRSYFALNKKEQENDELESSRTSHSHSVADMRIASRPESPPRPN